MTTFSGTSYLGLDRHADFVRLVQEGIQQYGVHYGGSRRSPLSPAIFAEAEAYLARWTGAPAALLVSSGTSAGQLVIRYLATRQYQFHYSPGVHPALWWPAAREHPDWSSWANSLLTSNTAGLTDAIDPLAVRQPDWSVLPAAGRGTLVVDDSHTIGILGPEGAGSWRSLRRQYSGPLIIVASLGKALALPAGLILGDQSFITALREQPQFGGASPPAPAPIYAFLQAATLISQQRAALRERIHFLQRELAGHPDFVFLPDYPVIAVHAHHWVERLAAAGITISSFRYPGPNDPQYSRIVLRADQPWADLQALVNCLNQG